MRWCWVVAVLCAFYAGRASAQATSVPDDAPLSRAELIYAQSFRDARLKDESLEVRFRGFALSYLRLSAVAFFSRSPWGAAVDLATEAFRIQGRDLLDRDADLGGLRGSRFSVAAVRSWTPRSRFLAEAQLGYAFGRVPVIDSREGSLRVGSLRYHGLQLAGIGHWRASDRLTAQLRARFLPRSFGADSPFGAPSLMDFGLGAQLSYELRKVGKARLWASADYELSSVTGSGGGIISLSQSAHRFGLGLRLTGLGSAAGARPVATGPGRVRGRVLLSTTETGVPGVQVAARGGSPVTSDAEGRFTLETAGSRQVELRASANGYAPTTATAAVSPGSEVSVVLRLERLTGPGSVKGLVLAPATAGGVKAPISGARVEVQGAAELRTDAEGRFTAVGVGPGPLSLRVQAPGFKTLEDFVSVPPAGEAAVELTLEKTGLRALASLRGQVRSVSGVPLRATLRVREAKVFARANAQGQFQVRLPGGRYTVVFSAPGYISQSRTLEVADGDQALFYVDLSPGDR